MMRNILLKSFILFCLTVSAIGCRQPEPLMPKSSAAAGIPAGFVAVFGKTGADPIVVCGNRTLAEHRFPPCSTFKIVSTLMGLDSGVLTGPESRLGYDGTRYEFAAWNGDLTLREAFRTSCVPYYKKLTGKLDRRTVQKTLDRLNYGNCDISVWNSNGHNVFW
ncbi:penicillin-binding transpeptidase domain-containing protein, partial [uncultured Victivallis sp.]|uniref:penicillin-binding transpeptidase domain-containing protein n=1 Tax=uncultured Victivallis sp. TaxID=354118 RepID=UPI0025939FC2